MPRAIVIGADGMLGRAIVAACAGRAIETVTPTREALNLADPKSMDCIETERPDWVVNCAAWTDVDGAEADEPGANKLNADAVGELASRCRDAGSVLVHYSTDYVFSGEAQSPYSIDEPRAPLNAYGRSKALGEVALEQSGAAYLLARTSWLYAPWGKNFVLTMRSLMKDRDELRVVDDQLGRPSSAEQVARRTLDLLEAEHRGTVHLCDGGQCTWHAFAAEIASQIGAATRIEPCSSDEYPRPAKRPAYSVLDLDSTDRVIGAPNDWKDELRGVLSRVEETV